MIVLPAFKLASQESQCSDGGFSGRSLDGTTQRSGTQLRIVPDPRKMLLRRVGQNEFQAPRPELVAHPHEHQIDDLLNLFEGQLVEHDDLVDPVQELGTEMLLERSGAFSRILS